MLSRDTHPTVHRAARTIMMAVFLAACGDGTGPQSPQLAAVELSGVSLDRATFHATGTFSIGVVPIGTDGEVILDGDVEVEGVLGPTPTNSSIALVSRAVQAAGSRPIAAALNIDNSGSMSGSDPDMLRASASQRFWDAVLGARSTNQVALADFGFGSTPGFGDTRLLEAWGRDTSILRQRLSSMAPGGGTPLYESALELLQWIDSTRSATSFERVMLLMTDGQPSSDTYRSAVADLAVARGITIHTVGLGVASDLSAFRSEPAVLRVSELAYRTGGVYAAATSPAALDTIFRTIARVSSTGQFLATFRMNPVPPSGTTVSGTVQVTSGGATHEATWSLVVP